MLCFGKPAFHLLFWGDACAYAQYIWNRTPNNRTSDNTTPWTVLTGERARWDKFKVFGCDVWQHIPNNSYYKVPGIPRGRRRIFLGFDVKYGGVLTFDLELRRYERTGNVIFNENFSYRQDALRCHDIRYGIQRVGGQQPLQVNDYHHPNASAVRNLFIDPDAPKPIDEDTPPDDAVIAPSSSTSPSTTLPSNATRGGAAANANQLHWYHLTVSPQQLKFVVWFMMALLYALYAFCRLARRWLFERQLGNS